jgi:hypothetical protein
VSIDAFEPGKSYSGILLTYYDEDQHTYPATLRFDARLGVEIEVSHASSAELSIFSDHPSHETIWLRGNAHIPDQCIFQSLAGSLTLTKLRNTFRSQNSRVTGARFVASETVFASTRGLINEPVPFDTFISHMDGLAEWWKAQYLVSKPHFLDDGRLRRVEITTVEDPTWFEWRQNGATMRIELGWRSNSSDDSRSMTLAQTTSLSSSFEGPRDANAHLSEHRKVQSLLCLMFSAPAPFREHAIVGESTFFREIPGKEGEERTKYFPKHAFVTDRTLRDRASASPLPKAYDDAVLWLSQIGSEGLALWGDQWEPTWNRLVTPVVAVLSRNQPYVEDVILATGIFLDAWGKGASKANGERATYSSASRPGPTFATYIFRALTLCGLDTNAAADSNNALAIAVRTVYTGVKHAEKTQPDPSHMIVISDVMLLLVRMLAALRITADDSLVRNYGQSYAAQEVFDAFSMHGLRVNAEGAFEVPFGPETAQPLWT